jgi:hypothetical protein
MAAKNTQTTFTYHGPTTLVVELGREVKNGDTVKGPDSLRNSFGFTPVEKAAKNKGEEAGS